MKKYRFFLFVTCAFLFSSLSVFSHSRDNHDRIFETVMFCYYRTVSNEQISLLEDASYLCLDQFNGNGQRQLDHLKKAKIKHIPSSISKFDFKDNSHHRWYTHRGWNHSYIDDRAKWPIRKEILKNTIKEIFPNGTEAQVDSLSSLVYYIHILGDHDDIQNVESYKKRGSQIMSFAQANCGKSNPDVCLEIEENITTLFGGKNNPKRNYTYNKLMQKLTEIHKEASTIRGYQGDLVTDNPNDSPGTRYNLYHECVKKYINALEEYLPGLLDPKFKELKGK